ncbi:hypothetical protein QN375_03130 [Pseudomonas sp. MH9.2]|uniref:hypothetical protein n=1 Tax=Pseudomonas sp. MH9.2 TaxID=3048629 RepID=UPI002AC94AA8|nr:hypothetical protein [Pseudomonas sp. MH9.2]MEB0024789.1 hypothetical protein [Pseudomonas sp. MH9.2]WPX70656.1 hypothetical protein RHM55_08915 [Pseudomonas sp. MH9.2]
MKIRAVRPVEIVIDVLCDVCAESTCAEDGGAEFGTLQASWGYGSQHDGERYKIALCEFCFFHTLSHLRRLRLQNTMFDEQHTDLAEFGRVARDDFWREI